MGECICKEINFGVHTKEAIESQILIIFPVALGCHNGDLLTLKVYIGMYEYNKVFIWYP